MSLLTKSLAVLFLLFSFSLSNAQSTFDSCMGSLKAEIDSCKTNYTSMPSYVDVPIQPMGPLQDMGGWWAQYYKGGCIFYDPSLGVLHNWMYCYATPPYTMGPPPPPPPPNDQVCKPGSTVRAEEMSVGEEVDVVGTKFQLVYTSERTIGKRKLFSTDFSLAPNSKKNIKGHQAKDSYGLPTLMDYHIALADGQQFLVEVHPGSTESFLWNGKNASGDYSEAPTSFVVSTETFGNYYSFSSDITQAYLVGTWNVKEMGLGGWNLDIHHRFYPAANRLYLGNGDSVLVTASQDASGYQVLSADGKQIFYFDLTGRHLTTNNALTNAILYTFNYASNGYLTSVVDAYGNTTSILRNGSGALTGIQAPYGQVTALTIGSDGYLASIQNPNGETYNMTYLTGGLIYTFQKPRGQTSTMSYDSVGNLLSDSSSAGDFINLLIDSTGKYLSISDALGLQQSSTIDWIQTAKTRSDVMRSGEHSSLNYEKDSTRYFDHGGVTTDQTNYVPNPRFPVGNSVPGGHYYTISPLGVTFSETYTQSVSNSSASPTPFNFDSIQTQTNTNGKISTSTYTRATGLTNIISASNRTSSNLTDVYGKITQTQQGTLLPVQFNYDTHGRLQYVTQGARQTQFQYDAFGNLYKMIDPLLQATTYTYDLVGRIATKTLPDLRVINYSYDANGNQTSVTPAGSLSHSFVFNAFDLPYSYTAPSVPTSTPSTYYTYNAAKQVTQVTRPDLSTVVFNYDPATKLLTSVVSSGDTTNFTMSNIEKISGAVSQDGISVTQADYDGIVASSSTTNSASLNIGSFLYTLNSDLKPTNLTISATGSVTSSVNYTYDSDRLMNSAGSEVISLDSTSGFATKVTLNKIQEIFSFDNSYGELISFVAKYVPNATTSTPLFSQTFTRDALGRIQTKAETVGGVTNNFSYTYDTANRLTDVTKNSLAFSHYTFDSNNNATSGNVGGISFSATYDSQDRLSSYNSNNYIHNVNGELKSKTVSGVTTTFTYNGFGMLKTAKIGSGAVLTYIYDGLNRRVGKKSGSTVQKYWVYQDQLRIGAELNASGNITKKFIYGNKKNVPDYVVIGSTTYKIISDNLGSVRVVVNASNGVIAQAMEYNERGEVVSDSSPGFQPFGFAGGLYDTDTKLVHLGERDYDPSIGRWISKDPIGFDGGDTNLYGYVLNDPINFIDPDGKAPSLVDLVTNNPGWCATAGAAYQYVSIRTQLSLQIQELQAEISALGKKKCDRAAAEKIKILKSQIAGIQAALDNATFWSYQQSMLSSCMSP